MQLSRSLSFAPTTAVTNTQPGLELGVCAIPPVPTSHYAAAQPFVPSYQSLVAWPPTPIPLGSLHAPQLDITAPASAVQPLLSSQLQSQNAELGLDLIASDTSNRQWNPCNNSFPQGSFVQNFSTQFAAETNNLAVSWAFIVRSHRGGSADASSWKHGQKIGRKCIGIIICNGPRCQAIHRPKTKPKALAQQLQDTCSLCGGNFLHMTCNVVSMLHTWKGGVHYRNGGVHQHAQPPAAHLSLQETKEFRDIVTAHPDAGPAALRVGTARLDGTARPAADITPLLNNIGRIAYQRRKVRDTEGVYIGGDEFMAAIGTFNREHPGFIVLMETIPLAIIVLQNDFMRRQSANVFLHKQEAVNGFHTDSAHKYFNSRAFLMITSCYSSVMQQWIPVVASWIPNGSADSLRPHFVVLFRGMYTEARREGKALIDDDFIMVG